MIDPAALAAASAELDEQLRTARKDFLFALLPAGMALISVLGVRRKRAQVQRAVHQAQIDADNERIRQLLDEEAFVEDPDPFLDEG